MTVGTSEASRAKRNCMCTCHFGVMILHIVLGTNLDRPSGPPCPRLWMRHCRCELRSGIISLVSASRTSKASAQRKNVRQAKASLAALAALPSKLEGPQPCHLMLAAEGALSSMSICQRHVSICYQSAAKSVMPCCFICAVAQQ